MKKKAKIASRVFKQCPSCQSKNLTTVEGEVLCDQCSWNSIEASVNAGCMDALFIKAAPGTETSPQSMFAGRCPNLEASLQKDLEVDVDLYIHDQSA